MKQPRTAEKGSALVYILIAIALLAALTVTFMEPSSQQTSSQNTFRSVAAAQGQIDTIRSAIQECILLYPNGDSSIDITGGADDEGADVIYPIRPDSDHFASTTPAATTGRLVRDIRCPGNPDASAADHTKIFSGARFLAPPPDLFGEWQYYNGGDGVFFWNEITNTDAFILSALEKIDDEYSLCEVDIIDATAGDVDMTSTSTTENEITCNDGATCLRVWMVANAAGAYITGSPEDGNCP